MRSWFRRVLPLFLLALAPAVAAAEEGELRPSDARVRHQVIAVIDAQLAAFRQHDLGRAYRLAAEALREQFSPARFASTVRDGYPEIWKNARAEYGIVEDNGVRALLEVRVFEANGESAAYDYVLFREPAGWRIGSVTLHPESPAGGPASA